MNSDNSSRLKPLFTPFEFEVLTGIVAALKRDNGSLIVQGKVKLTDVIEIRKSGLTDDEFNYATRAHLDFVVYRELNPVLAIESDFKDKHGKCKQQAQLKDRICSDLGLPLVRLSYRWLPLVTVPPVTEQLLRVWQSDCFGASGNHCHVHRGCLLHGADCEFSLCGTFQERAAELIAYHGLLDQMPDVSATAELSTTLTKDGYAQSKVVLWSHGIGLNIGQGWCRSSEGMKDFGVKASQLLALAHASSVVQHVDERFGLWDALPLLKCAS